MTTIIAFLLVGLVVGLRLLFKDTMNRIQYLERLHVYWIARDNGVAGSPFAVKAFMRQTSAPYWRGRGVQFRVGLLTFQVGKLRMRVDSLDSQISSHVQYFEDLTPKELRTWKGRSNAEA